MVIHSEKNIMYTQEFFVKPRLCLCTPKNVNVFIYMLCMPRNFIVAVQLFSVKYVPVIIDKEE